MVYYDKSGHLVPFGQEELYINLGRMDICSEIRYSAHKSQEERNKSLMDILDKSRKENMPKLNTPIDLSEFL